MINKYTIYIYENIDEEGLDSITITFNKLARAKYQDKRPCYTVLNHSSEMSWLMDFVIYDMAGLNDKIYWHPDVKKEVSYRLKELIYDLQHFKNILTKE